MTLPSPFAVCWCVVSFQGHRNKRKEDSKIRCLKSSQEYCSFFLLLSSAAVWLVLSLCSSSFFFQAFASTLRKSWLAPLITGWENIMNLYVLYIGFNWSGRVSQRDPHLCLMCLIRCLVPYMYSTIYGCAPPGFLFAALALILVFREARNLI